MILCRITKDITWQKVVRIHDSYCEWYEKNETIAGLANSKNPMNRQENLIIYMLFMGSLMLQRIVSQHCKGDIYSDYQMMLKGHTYKTIKVRRGSLDCRQACLADTRCRSYNVLFFQQICQLTDSTKEASPDDFVQDNERYHMAKSGKNP